jgi:F-type H+-transporting ATPase subunit beta
MKGVISQVMGPVVDVDFKDYLPKINEAIEVNFTEDTSEIDAKAEAMIKASDSMIKEVRKYL